MNRAEMDALLGRVSYRDFKFRIMDDPCRTPAEKFIFMDEERLLLRLEVVTPDAADPTKDVPIYAYERLALYMIVEPWVFLMQVWRLIERYEAHERMEHLRLDGAQLYDPHPGGGSASVPQFEEVKL